MSDALVGKTKQHIPSATRNLGTKSFALLGVLGLLGRLGHLGDDPF